MKNKTKIISLIFITILITIRCSPGSAGGNYSPLYKYREFPMKKIWPIVSVQRDTFLTIYEGFKTELAAHSGIISNDNYVKLSGNDVIHISNGATNLLYSFSTMENIEYLDANEEYIAFLSNNDLIVIDKNGSNYLNISVNPTNFIAALGNGNSPLVVYGEIENYVTLYLTSQEYNKHNLNIKNIESGILKQLPYVYDVIGFNKNNKYIFFNYYSGIWYMKLINKQGIISFYDIINETNIIIGDYIFDENISYGIYWSDATIGITEDLTKFYVLQARTEYYAIEGPLADGRSPQEVAGVWEIDISSLGLSE